MENYNHNCLVFASLYFISFCGTNAFIKFADKNLLIPK